MIHSRCYSRLAGISTWVWPVHITNTNKDIVINFTSKKSVLSHLFADEATRRYGNNKLEDQTVEGLLQYYVSFVLVRGNVFASNVHNEYEIIT